MKKHLPVLVTLLTFGSFSVVGDDEKTIVCLMDGKSKQNVYYSSANPMISSINPVKISLTIRIDSSKVKSFKHKFLTDNEFHQPSIWQHGIENNKIDYETSITDDEIIISLTERDQGYQHSAINVFIFGVRYKLNIDRKTGIGKVDASLNSRVYDLPVSGLDLENMKTFDYENHNIDYSAFGDCSLSKNKF